MNNYYKVLGVKRNASKQQINVAFKKLSFQFHPDRNGGNSFYSELFKEINEAKQVLLDEEKRAQYDSNLKKQFFSKDFLARKDDRLLKKTVEVVYKKKNVEKIIESIKWGSAIVGLAAVIFLIMIAINNGIRLLSKERTEQSVFEIKELKKDSVLATANIEKKTEEQVIRIPPAKSKVEPEAKVERKNGEGNFLSKDGLDQKPEQAKKNAQPTKLIEVKADKKTKEDLKDPTKKNQTVAVVSRKENLVINKNKAIERKQLTDDAMAELLKDLTSKKSGSGSKINCVKILVSASSNVSNAFDITTFLHNKGLIISGRETIKERVDGIKIGTRGDCFVVTIGNI